jgi:hypothetical protein
LTKNRNCVIVAYRWTKRRLTRRRKAAAIAPHGETEGIRLRGRYREIIMRLWKGWRPSACRKARNRFGLFRGRKFLASHRIDRLSYPRSSGSSPESRSLRPRPRTTPPRRSDKPRQDSAKTAPALRFAFKLEPEDRKRQTTRPVQPTPSWPPLISGPVLLITYRFCDFAAD